MFATCASSIWKWKIVSAELSICWNGNRSVLGSVPTVSIIEQSSRLSRIIKDSSLLSRKFIGKRTVQFESPGTKRNYVGQYWNHSINHKYQSMANGNTFSNRKGDTFYRHWKNPTKVRRKLVKLIATDSILVQWRTVSKLGTYTCNGCYEVIEFRNFLRFPNICWMEDG